VRRTIEATTELWALRVGGRTVGLVGVRLSPWDSAQFDCRVGVVDPVWTVGPLEQMAAGLRAALEDMRGTYDYLFHRVAGHAAGVLQALQEAGFVVVDGLVTFGLDVPDVTLESLEVDVAVRPAECADWPGIEALSASAFRYDRVHADASLGPGVAARFYRSWAANCLQGRSPRVWVAEVEDQMAGYLAALRHPAGTALAEVETGVVDLVAVDERFRGRAVGIALMHRFLAWCAEERIPFALVGTSLSNIGAVRLYEKLRFRMIDSALSLRRWLA
jgi:ribosomal protein S18 acetylase RimI-like enzyme